MMTLSEHLEEKRQLLPDKPGVYLMKDHEGQVIYVGKAVNLKQRVRSYFQEASRLLPKVAAMMRHVEDFEIITTDTEVEALILEATLIKKYRPHYNIRLKDDKAYPYIRLTWEEDFPRLIIARRPDNSGSRYFGPYTRAQSVHETIRLLRHIFPIRNCTNQKFKNAARPCLEYHIKRCPGPCQALIDKDSYRDMMKNVEWFLEGKVDAVEKSLVKELNRAAEELEFEKAAKLRDQVMAVREITAQQKVSAEAGRNLDAISWALSDQDAYLQVFMVRDGRLIGRESFTLTGVDGTDEKELAHAFLMQYYDRARDIPQEILIEHLPPDDRQITAWLREKRGGKVDLKVPVRGEKQRLLAMVRQNATIARDEALRRMEIKERDRERALLEIQQTLGLPGLPRRMECYDISNTQGTESVASMVVFTDGKPDKSQYRRFKIQSVEGPNDFLSMKEVITRRFHHQAQDAKQMGKSHFAKTPDLVIIDGGRGQLGYAYQAMRELNVADIPVFGLAKQHEWLFEPERSDPIILDRDSAGLKLLMHLRDEAHRFAITYHRKLRTKRNLASILDDIEGIGPARKKILRQTYGDLAAISQASVDELAALPKMTRPAAEAVKRYLDEHFKSNEEENAVPE
ncbi:excinuclease ABC subunit UvrC [Sulfobacillus thermosulfidooxidans]|uniref:excinuclease ABC subunit UvrC n=1 Tax=Sulfobacillus thermosulfidooxidans TaxID=28034 RepID=UPI000379B905|nr:excinuclease ABC subunit UvrC [Sulfobacillus thermosulfidooxidans]